MGIKVKPVIQVIKRRSRGVVKRKPSSFLGKSVRLALKTTIGLGKLMSLVLVGRL